jgi:hypothetical protein
MTQRITNTDLKSQLKRLVHNTGLMFRLVDGYGCNEIVHLTKKGEIIQVVTRGTTKKVYDEILTSNKIIEMMRKKKLIEK